MAGDYLAAVAQLLASHPKQHHGLGAFAAVVAADEPDRQHELEGVRAAIELLDALGLVAFNHHVVASSVAVLHRAGLRRLAAGEPLAVVADDVERGRPLTVIRVAPDRWAAWYRSTLRLPAGVALGIADDQAAIGKTADEAVAVLRQRVRVTAGLDTPPDQVTTRQ